MSQLVWMGSSGCLLPFLILFNLFFGKFFINSTRLWLSIEAVLILIFIINIKIMARKISQQFNQSSKGKQKKVIDIQGQVVEDEKRLK